MVSIIFVGHNSNGIEMKISITIDNMDFDLEIEITSYGYHKSAVVGREADHCSDSEGEDHEFNIESVSTAPEIFIGLEWRQLDPEEKSYFNALIMKSKQFKHNNYSEKERALILEKIGEEFEYERCGS